MSQNKDQTNSGSGSGSPDVIGGSSNLTRKEEWGSITDILKSIENTSRRSRTAPQSAHKRMPPLTENIQTAPHPGEAGQGMQQLDHLLRLMEQMCALRRQNNKLREHAQYLTAMKTLQDIRNEQLTHDCSCEVHRIMSDHSSSSSPMGNLESFSEPESHAGDDYEVENKYHSNRLEKRMGRTISRESKGRSVKKRSKSLDPFGEEVEEMVKERGRPGIFSKFEKMKEKLTNRRGSVKRRSGVKGFDEDGKKYDSELGVPIDGLETKSEDSGFYQNVMDDSILLGAHKFELPQRGDEEFSDGEEVFDARQSALNQREDLRQVRKVSDVSTGSSSEDFHESKKKHKKYRSQPPSGSSQSDQNEDVHRARRRSRFNKSSSFQDFNSSVDTDPSPSNLPDPLLTPRRHARLEQSLSMDTEMPDLTGRLGAQSPKMGSVDSKLGQKRKHAHKAAVMEFSDPSLSSSPESRGGDQLPRSSSPPEKKRNKETKSPVDGSKQALSSDMMTMYENIQANLSEDFLIKLEAWDKKKQKGGPGQDMTKQSSVESTSSEPGGIPGNEQAAELLQGLSEEFSKKLAEWDKKKKGTVGPSPKGDRRQKSGGKEKKEKCKKEDKGKIEESVGQKKAEGEKVVSTSRKVVVIENEEGLVKIEGASKEFEDKFREWEHMHRSPSDGQKKKEKEDAECKPPECAYPLPAFQNVSDSNSSLATPIIVEPTNIPRSQQTKHEMASQADFTEDGVEPADSRPEGEPRIGDEPISTLEKKNLLLAEKLKKKNVNLEVIQSELQVVQEQLEKMTGWKGVTILPDKLEAQVQTIQEEETPKDQTTSNTTEELTKSLQQRENLIKFLQMEVERQRREINFLRSDGPGGAHFKRAKSFSARDRNFDTKAMQVMDIPLGKSLACRGKKDSPNSTPSLSNASSSDHRNRESMSITTESTQSLETLHISAEDIRMEDLCSQTLEQPDHKREEPTPPGTTEETKATIPETIKTETTLPKQEEPIVAKPEKTPLIKPDARKEDIKDEDKSKGTESFPSGMQQTKDRKSQGGKQHPLDAHIPSSIVAQKISSLKEKASSASDSDSKDEKVGVRKQRTEPKWKVKAKTSEAKKSATSDSSKESQDGVRKQGTEPKWKIKGQTSEPKTATESDSSRECQEGVRRQRPEPKWKGKDQAAETKASSASQALKEIQEADKRQRSEPTWKVKAQTVHSKAPAGPDLLKNIQEGEKKSEPTWKVKAQSVESKSSHALDAPKENQDGLRRSRPRIRANKSGSEDKAVKSVEKCKDTSQNIASLKSNLNKVQPTDKKPPIHSSTAKTLREKKSQGDTTVESDVDSSIKSDTEIRKSFEALSSKRRDSSDSVGSSRRSSPASRFLEKYDPKFAKSIASNKVEVSSVGDLKAKFSGGAQHDKSGNKSEDEDSFKARREKPKIGSVKMLSQAFAVSSGVNTDISNAPAAKGEGTGASSIRSTPSVSPASSCSSLSSSHVSDRIKRLQDRRTHSLKETTSEKNTTRAAKLPVSPIVRDAPKLPAPLLPNKVGYRSSMPNLRARFEQNSSGDAGSSGLRVQQKSGSTGKLSFTVSVSETKETKSETNSRPEVKSVRVRARPPRLVAVIETPGKDKPATEMVTFKLRSPNSRRAARTNNSNQEASELNLSEPKIPTVTEKVSVSTAEDISASAPSLRIPCTEEKRSVEERLKQSKVPENQTSSSDPQIGRKVKGESPESKEGAPQEKRTVSTGHINTDQKLTVTNSDKAHIEKLNKTSLEELNKKPPKEIKLKSSSPKETTVDMKDKSKTETRRNSSKTESDVSESTSPIEKRPKSKSNGERGEGKKTSKGSGKVKKGGGGGKQGGDQKSRKSKTGQQQPSTSQGGKEGKGKGKRKGNKRAEQKREQETNSRNSLDSEKHSIGDDSGGSRSSLNGENFPDLLAETPKVRDSVIIDDNGNKTRNPRQAVAASALQGAIAAIGHALPDPVTKAELEESPGDERRSRKDKTRRGRMMSKADKLSKLDLFRRARSVDTSKGSRDRSPSLERPGRSGRASSVDRSNKKRDKSPTGMKGKGKDKDGQKGGWKRILRASNDALLDPIPDSEACTDSLSTASTDTLTEIDSPVCSLHTSEACPLSNEEYRESHLPLL